MKKRGILSNAVVPVVLFGIAIMGCNQSTPGKKQLVIGLSVPALSHPFFVCIQKNVQDEGKKLGVTIIATEAGDLPDKQMANVENFVVQGVDGVVIAPIGADVLVPSIEKLNKAGIPVATVDREASGGEVLVHVGGDNVEGGRIAARYILDKIGGKGEVIQLEGLPGSSPAIDRKKGFEEVIAASKAKVVASQAADFYRAKGQSVMENLLQVHGDIQGLYAANDEMVLGAIEAMSSHGIKPGKVVTVGYDVIPDAVKSIQDGSLTASIEQFPGQQARKALDILVAKIRDGKSPESKKVSLTPIVIDLHNLDKAESKE